MGKTISISEKRATGGSACCVSTGRTSLVEIFIL
jgi:hypothetical protein